ncbi:MAG: OsmC family protein [Chloroflexi bacterium]|nr:OsmC family protein [Chloroflexota bacterium]
MWEHDEKFVFLADFGESASICAKLTLIARELGIQLDRLSVQVEGDLNPDRLFGKSYADRAGFKSIRLNLQPGTSASPDLLVRWVQEIKNRCPINDNLLNPTPIDFQLINTYPEIVHHG